MAKNKKKEKSEVKKPKVFIVLEVELINDKLILPNLQNGSMVEIIEVKNEL